MPESLTYWDVRAGRYHQRGGFAPERKTPMLEVAQDLLTAMVPPRSTLLELGAGTGRFTDKLLQSHHFREIWVTDGSPSMLAIAEESLGPGNAAVQFVHLDFSRPWPVGFPKAGMDAVTSSMALHHAMDKEQVFRQVLRVLKPGGAVVFADHVVGTSACTQYLVGRERALVLLGRENEDPERVREMVRGMRRGSGRRATTASPSSRSYAVSLPAGLRTWIACGATFGWPSLWPANLWVGRGWPLSSPTCGRVGPTSAPTPRSTRYRGSRWRSPRMARRLVGGVRLG